MRVYIFTVARQRFVAAAIQIATRELRVRDVQYLWGVDECAYCTVEVIKVRLLCEGPGRPLEAKHSASIHKHFE